MKVLSFIVPAYNSEAFLDVGIPSMLLPEILDKLEIIIVNDGSSDKTAEIARGYCEKYPGTVRLISQENKGHGGALNTGCAAAQGKYLKVIDADDWVESQNLPAFIHSLESISSDVVLTHYHTVDISTGEIRNWKCYPKEFGKALSFHEIMENWKDFSQCLVFHGITYRREFYQEHGISLSEHVFYEDYEYATYPCCHARQITPLDLTVYDYRIGDVAQSVSEESRLKRLGHTQTVLQRMTEEFGRLSESPDSSRDYAAMKLQELLLSYLTTVLLVHPDKALGRRLAREQMNACKHSVPKAYALARPKYWVFLTMNLLHFTKGTWDSILSSEIYRIIRGKHRSE